MPSFSVKPKSLPAASMVTATAVLGAVPLKGAAKTLSVSDGSGSGLSSASRTWGEVLSLAGTLGGAGALPRGAV